MKLRAKFNLAIILAMAVGYGGAGLLLYNLSISNARQEVLENARVMMSAANAVQAYTDQQVVPITGLEQNGSFVTAAVPFYAAKTAFKSLHAQFPAYSLAEVAINPTNKEDTPTDWQADFITEFRNTPGATEQVGERDTPTGAVLDLAQPISVSDPSCLACHSTPAVAPASMIAKYGSDNGFGWTLGEIVGAQIVSVPLDLPLARAHAAFESFMAILAVVFVVVLLILNLLLHFIVIRPLVKVSTIANAVSLGQPAEEYVKPGSDEVSSLSASFNRMRRSLDSAMRMLTP